jgi:hypothetical protein
VLAEQLAVAPHGGPVPFFQAVEEIPLLQGVPPRILLRRPRCLPLLHRGWRALFRSPRVPRTWH